MAGVGRKMFVAGGSGFVGSAICREAIRVGYEVTSLSRTGRPAHIKEKWADLVDWRTGNVFTPKTYVDALRGADAVVSTIGKWGIGGSTQLLEANGDTGVFLAQLAHRECTNLAKFGFVSAQPWSATAQRPFRSFFQGKQKAELVIQSLFPKNYLILRPVWVFGWKHVYGPLWFPWQLIGAPLEYYMSALAHYYFHSKLTVPPTPVEELAHVMVLGCTVGRDVAGLLPTTRVRDIMEREAQNRPLTDWLRPMIHDHNRMKKEYFEKTNFTEKYGIEGIKRKGWETFLLNSRLRLNRASTRPEFAEPTRSIQHLVDRFVTPSYRMVQAREQQKLIEANREKTLLFEERRRQEYIAGEMRLLGETPDDIDRYLKETAGPAVAPEEHPRLTMTEPKKIAPPGDLEWKLKQTTVPHTSIASATLT